MNKTMDALRCLYEATPHDLDCYAFHHSEKDRHGVGEACKPMERYIAAREKAITELFVGRGGYKLVREEVENG